MAIEFVGAGTYTVADSGISPATSTMDIAGLEDGDCVIAISPGRGGDGAYQAGMPRGTEVYTWMNFNALAFTSGTVGNRFNQHDARWTRYDSSLGQDTLYWRNFGGSGIMVAFRGLEYIGHDENNAGDVDTAASGTLTISADTPDIAEGQSIAFTILHEFWGNFSGGVPGTWDDTDFDPSMIEFASVTNDDRDNYRLFYTIFEPGDTLPALSIDFTHSALTFRSINLDRSWLTTDVTTAPDVDLSA